MASYKLSTDADQKLAQIYEYSLIHFGLEQGDKYFLSLHETFLLLSEQPQLGRKFHEYRRHEHARHVIVYKTETDGVLIIKMLHEQETTDGKFT